MLYETVVQPNHRHRIFCLTRPLCIYMAFAHSSLPLMLPKHVHISLKQSLYSCTAGVSGRV